MNLVWLGHVRRKANSLPARLADGIDCLCWHLNIRGGNLRALARELQRNRPANAGGRAGDQDFAVHEGLGHQVALTVSSVIGAMPCFRASPWASLWMSR